MYSTGNDDYQFFKVFARMLNSLQFDSNKKVTSRTYTGILQKKFSHLTLFLL